MVLFAKKGPLTAEGLTAKQVAFVREYVERAGRPGAGPDAAVAAGFAPPTPAGRKMARTRAYELLHDQFVLKTIREELKRKLSAGAALGVQVLIDLALGARSEQVRLSAANSLIDRGYAPVMSRNATIRADASVEDLLTALDSGHDKGGEPLVIEGEASPAPDGQGIPRRET